MPTLPLSKGKRAVVDVRDWPSLSAHKWHALARNGVFHAVRSIKRKGFRKTIYMHREILKAPKHMLVDHKNGDGLDNRRKNIRLCTKSQNAMNCRHDGVKKTSRYHGVCWVKAFQLWRPTITILGKQLYLGRFKNEKQAALAYDKAARKHFGAFAKTNF